MSATLAVDFFALAVLGAAAGCLTETWRRVRRRATAALPKATMTLSPRALASVSDQVIRIVAAATDGTVYVQRGRDQFGISRDAAARIAQRDDPQARLCFCDDEGHVQFMLTSGESLALTIGLRRLRELEDADVPAAERPS